MSLLNLTGDLGKVAHDGMELGKRAVVALERMATALERQAVAMEVEAAIVDVHEEHMHVGTVHPIKRR